MLTAASLQPQVAAGLRWRLFDFGRIDADVARAKGANAEALAAYRKAVLHAAEDDNSRFLGLPPPGAPSETQCAPKPWHTCDTVAHMGGTIEKCDIRKYLVNKYL